MGLPIFGKGGMGKDAGFRRCVLHAFLTKSHRVSPQPYSCLEQVRDNFMLAWHLSGFLWLTTPKSAQLPSPFPIIFILYVKDLRYPKLQMGFKRKPQIRIKSLVKQLLSSIYMHSNYVSLHFQDLKSA